MYSFAIGEYTLLSLVVDVRSPLSWGVTMYTKYIQYCGRHRCTYIHKFSLKKYKIGDNIMGAHYLL